MKTRLRDFPFEVKIGSSHTNMAGRHLVRCFGISPWMLKDIYSSADISLRLLNYKQLQVNYCGTKYVYNRRQSNCPLTAECRLLFDGDTILAPWEVFNFEDVIVEETNLKPVDVNENMPTDWVEKVYHLETDDLDCYCTKDEVLA